MNISTRFNEEKLHDHSNCDCKAFFLVHFENALEFYNKDTGKTIPLHLVEQCLLLQMSENKKN